MSRGPYTGKNEGLFLLGSLERREVISWEIKILRSFSACCAAFSCGGSAKRWSSTSNHNKIGALHRMERVDLYPSHHTLVVAIEYEDNPRSNLFVEIRTPVVEVKKWGSRVRLTSA